MTDDQVTQKSEGGQPCPVYLIVADATDEFETALRYGAHAAARNKAKLAVLHVLTDEESTFMPWSNVSERIEQAQKQQAEDTLEYVKNFLKSKGVEPIVYLREGHPPDVVQALISENKHICKLILAANTEDGNPGPLVSYFSGSGLKELDIPLTIVPSHINFEHSLM